MSIKSFYLLDRFAYFTGITVQTQFRHCDRHVGFVSEEDMVDWNETRIKP